MRKTLLFILLLSSFSLTAQMQMRLRGSHNPVLTPQQVDSLFYWFDAANLSSLQDSVGGAIATDEGVATWYDMSGRGYHVTQTTNTQRPVYKATGGPGSKPCIQFDGSNDNLISTSHLWASVDISIFIVMKWASATTNATEYVIVKNGTAENQFIIYGNPSSAYKIVHQYRNPSTAYHRWVLTSAKSTAWRLHSSTQSGSNTTLNSYLDGATDSNTYSSSGSPSNGIFSGSGAFAISVPGYSIDFKGSISEIIVYSKALTADERVGIEEYLQAKWGL